MPKKSKQQKCFAFLSFEKSRVSKSLNSSYNYSYNKSYKNKPITFHTHLFSRKNYRNLDLDMIETTVKSGKINYKKSKRRKLCLERYFGKLNLTYIVIIRIYKNDVEVRTAWIKKGK
ncbi:MAG: hypothetical protein ISS25_04470 [Nanoarchaeota archaeon]|nr:hypothetical protein [DPANN group archaeon]MBL7117056.1 hypothetical protein [Nanoarchaeota archaeon]